jgi:hypothetical protein
MLAEAHRRAAEDIEKTILPLQTTPHAARIVIEEHGVPHFIGLPLAVKQNIKAIRNITHVWEPFSAVRERMRLPNGGKT